MATASQDVPGADVTADDDHHTDSQEVTGVVVEQKSSTVQLKTTTVPLPYGAADGPWAVVRVSRSGICGTDMQLMNGYYPCSPDMFIGHEFVGVVEKVGQGGGADLVGRRVVAEINVQQCGAGAAATARDGHSLSGPCDLCARGRKTHCSARSVVGILNRHGCHASHVVLPVRNLVHVPDSVPDLQAVFAEPLAAALQMVEEVHVKPTHRVLVIGCGRLGQLALRVLRLSGCEVVACMRTMHSRLKKLAEATGARVVEVSSVPSDTYDVVVECSGNASGLATAVRAVLARGKIICKSTFAGNSDIPLSRIVVKEVQLIGSRCGPMQAAVRVMERGLIDPSVLVDCEVAHTDAVEAFRRAALPGALKVLLVMPGGEHVRVHHKKRKTDQA